MAPDRKLSASPEIPRTLSQTIYNYLRDAIITNRIKANQRIIEKEIADRFGISTTPVREAVLRLGAEGYISIDSHRKATVKEISQDELKDIYAVLGALDPFAAGQVIGRFPDSCLARLERLTANMEAAMKNRDPQRFLSLNGEIHELIWDELPNQVLRRSLLDLHGQLKRYTHARIKAYEKPEIMAASLEEHQAILAALRSKDRIRLKNLIRLNWRIPPTRLSIIPEKKKGGPTASKGGGAGGEIEHRPPISLKIPNEEER